MKRFEATISEACEIYEEKKSSKNSEARLNLMKKWNASGLFDVVGKIGSGPRAPIVLSGESVLKGLLFSRLHRVGFSSRQIEKTNEFLRSSQYASHRLNIPPSLRGEIRWNVIADAVRGIEAGETWHLVIEFTEDAVECSVVWPDYLEEENQDDAAMRAARDLGILRPKLRADTILIIAINELFEPLL